MDKRAFFSSCFFTLYGAAWRLALPLLRRHRRLREGFAERLAGEGWCGPHDLWVQAASGGEAHLALSVLQALPANVDVRVLLCTWTKQGRDLLEAGMAALRETHPRLLCTARYAPLDHPAIVRSALRQARPRALILLETELWPALLDACAREGIAAHVVNGRMSEGAYPWYRLLRPLLRTLPLRGVHAISEEDAARYRYIFGLGADSPCVVRTMPNIKFDRAAEALKSSSAWEEEPLFRKSGPLFLLASVREQEEASLLPLLDSVFAARPEACVVIAPRHMHRVKAWQEGLQALGLRPLTASRLMREAEGECSVPPGRALVWDLFGTLPQLYAMADAVFVGGSLGLGGQNFLEALAAGLVPCVGPSLEKFRWALGEEHPPSLTDAALLTLCRDARDVPAALLAEAERRRDRREVRERFRAWLAPRVGASRLAAGILLDAANLRMDD